jgi:hypothetical protein
VYVVMGAHDVLFAPLDTLRNDVEALVTTVCIEEIRHSESETADAATDLEDVRGWVRARNTANIFQRAPTAGGEVHRRTGKHMGFRREPGIVAAEQSVNEVDWCQVHLAQNPAQLTRKRWQQPAVEPCLLEQPYSKALGRTITYQDIPVEAWREGLLQRGLPAHLVNHLATMADLHRAGRYDRMSDDVFALTGQKPRSMQEFVRKNAATFTDSAKAA